MIETSNIANKTDLPAGCCHDHNNKRNGSSRLPINRNLIIHIPGLARFPLIVPKVLKNYFRLVFLGRKVLRSVDLSVTFDCQCLCEHCYSHLMKNDVRPRLSPEEMLNVIDQCLDLGAVVINFAGGEPLCEPNIIRYIRHVKPWRGVTTMMTNGLMLTKEMAKELKKANLYVIGISIDSDKEEVHDRIRNHKGAFEKAMSGISYARSEGITVLMNTIITQAKIDDGSFDNILALSRKMGTILNVCFPAAVGLRAPKGFEIFREDGWRKIEEILKYPDVRWDGQSNWLHEGCGAGIEKISVSTHGDVIPCAVIQASFGNVKENSLREIWEKMTATPPFGRLNQRCLASQDMDFFKTRMEAINTHPELPCRASEVFGETSGT